MFNEGPNLYLIRKLFRAPRRQGPERGEEREREKGEREKKERDGCCVKESGCQVGGFEVHWQPIGLLGQRSPLNGSPQLSLI